ncbi:LPS assembly lipoprotein LptE [Sodalis sp. CWE]|uniref:LPS assembly lipoprotein LptE n=1 Tax=Sodalis sp. CWE TaxID=2803816 RepID=UPI001C7D47D4|nr:LPS assembly lipoprotein LptE [Sodalis sp. CWE]MBX4180930.1 LPS assembly lipoprotein LptE [Sodalis sp. CWE]
MEIRSMIRCWTLVIWLATMIITGCGYHLRDVKPETRLEKIKIVTLSSYDPYGPLTYAVRQELRLNNIKLVNNDSAHNKNNSSPLLHIIDASENQIFSSVFQSEKIVECQITLNVNAQVVIIGKDTYPINIKIYRSFFNNPVTALANNVEESIIRQEMQEEAAHQMVHQFLIIANNFIENSFKRSKNS